MRIESYNVRMDSAGTRSSNSTRKLQIRLQGGMGKNQISGSLADAALDGFDNDNSDVKNNHATEDSFASRLMKLSAQKANSMHDRPTEVRDLQSIKQQFVLYLWRMLFGDESAKDMAKKYGIEDLGNNENGTRNVSNNQGNVNMNTIQLFGVEEVYEQETQELSFTSRGQVTTADGRQIDFGIDIAMTSSFERYYRSEGIPITNMCDPLVLNFGGDVAGLSDQKFTFDLDCDGVEENISMLSAGNGFLALDKNNDGIINNGSELFGTKSGDGFRDLAQYDLDGNGWIDENDDIFSALKIWYKDETGQDKLLNLKESGVGAIYLGNATTDYFLRSGNSFEVNGAIRKMGLFLYENATVGTIAHLDIAN